MTDRKEAQKLFADFIREYLKKNKPTDWDNSLFGEFPGTILMYQKYFGSILRQNSNPEKIKAIEERYKLNKDDSVQKKIKVIDGRPRSIKIFFSKKIVPHEDNLNFIALIFDVPVQTVEEFVAYKHKSKLEKEPIIIEPAKIKPVVIKHVKTVKTKNKIGFKNILTKRNAVVAMSVVFSFILITIILQKYNFTDNKLNAANQPKEETGFFPQDIDRDLFVKKVSVTNSTKISEEDTVLLHTVNIFNDKCLHKNSVWSFATDPNGEDMNSKYGEPFNEEIKTKFKDVLNGRTTIANEYMDIHFNLENLKNKTLYFSNLKIKIINTYDAKGEKAQYNMYESRSAEIKFELILDDKNTQGFTVDKEELKHGEALFCKMRVKGSEISNNLIYRFQIVADFVDTKGKHYQAVSDKNYLIGFVSEN